MQILIDTRDPSSEEATAAREFAQLYELKQEILIGFMADAGAELVKQIRAWEPENTDLGSYMEPVWQLVQTVTVLFPSCRKPCFG